MNQHHLFKNINVHISLFGMVMSRVWKCWMPSIQIYGQQPLKSFQTPWFTLYSNQAKRLQCNSWFTFEMRYKQREKSPIKFLQEVHPVSDLKAAAVNFFFHTWGFLDTSDQNYPCHTSSLSKLWDYRNRTFFLNNPF